MDINWRFSTYIALDIVIILGLVCFFVTRYSQSLFIASSQIIFM